MKKLIKEYTYIILGTTILAFGVTLFLEPNQIVTGGVVGIGIILNDISTQKYNVEIPIWLTNICFNIPLFLIAIGIRGKDFGLKSFFASMYLSLALYITSFIPVEKYDLLLSSIYGGVLSGIGLGLVFQAFCTTGGTDMLASLIQKFIKHITVGNILFYIDTLIIGLGFYIFGTTKGLHAIIAIFVTSKVLDSMLEGVKFAKVVYIVSEKSEDIGSTIIKKLERGVTSLDGKGLYSNKDKKVLMCVVGKREIYKLKELINNIDPSAFVVVHDAREVLGEGFENISINF